MAYTVTTRTTYGQRLGKSLKGIVTGFIMFLIGTVVLFWNEGNFVKTKKSLQEAESVLVRVRDASQIDPALDGKLIHASAFADTQETLMDGLFGVSEVAIALSRSVEYYQHKENSRSQTRDLVGGGQETVTTYTYERAWSATPINSGAFNDPSYKNSNFTLTTVEQKTERAKDVSFGAYKLPAFIIASITGSIPAAVNLSTDEIAQWQQQVARNNPNAQQMVHVSGNTVYFGASPTQPAIGDLRVTLTKILPADVSVIAKVFGNTFEHYIAKNGKTVSSVSMGTVSPEAMFAGEHSANKMLAWILRLVGMFLVVGGLKAMFGILPTLFKVLPFLGNIVGAGVGFVCSIVGGAWSLVIIGISWLFYRPLIGIPLLLLAASGIWLLKKRAKESKTSPPTAPEEPATSPPLDFTVNAPVQK